MTDQRLADLPEPGRTATMTANFSNLVKRLDDLLRVINRKPAEPVLRRSTLWILDTDARQLTASLLVRSLAFHGLRDSQLASRSDLSSLWRGLNHNALPLLVSVSSNNDEVDHESAIDSWSGRHSVPWMRMVINPQDNWVDIGPIFVKGATPCYNCFRYLHCNSSIRRATFKTHYSMTAFWCNVAAPFLIHLGRQYEQFYIPDGFRRYSMMTLRHEYLRRTFLPLCSCRTSILGDKGNDASMEQHDAISVKSLMYEDYTCRERPKHNQIEPSIAASNLVKNSLQPQQYPHSRIDPLPPPSQLGNMSTLDLLRGACATIRTAPTTSELSSVLLYSVGLRSIEVNRNDAQRWTASAGNLGSPELFICAKDVAGLESGIYRYRCLSHDLVHLAFRKAGWIHDLLGGCAAGENLVFFTGAYYRLQNKYGPFAYRLVHLDGGVAYSQAALVANSMGGVLKLLKCNDERESARNLNLSSMGEYLTAITRLAFMRSSDSFEENEYAVSDVDRSAVSVGDIRHLSVGELTDSLHLESMYCSASSKSARHYPVRRERLSHEIIDRPKASDSLGGLTLSQTLVKRRSVREFAQGEMPPESTIATMVELAQAADICDWPVEHAEGRDLHFYLLEQRRNRLSEFNLTSGAFDLVTKVPGTPLFSSLYVDVCFHKAPIAIWIVGDLSLAVASVGSRGHRQLLFRAGAAANRLWLAAISMGLEGAISGGLLPRVARTILGFDGWTRLALCAFLGGTA